MDDNGSASTSIDIEVLRKKQTTWRRKEICIYQVPLTIRRINDVAYTPKVICIGPIHHKNENQVMKKLKQRYFRQFFNRLPEETGKLLQKELEETINNCENEIRNCYEDDSFELCKGPKDCEVETACCFEDDSSTICKEQKVFSKMILLDAVFIFELFLKTREYKKDSDQGQDKYKFDYIIGQPWLKAAIQRDLILLENQLPFWILDKLFKIAANYIKPDCSCSQSTLSHEPGSDRSRCNQDPKPNCSSFQCIGFHKLYETATKYIIPDCCCSPSSPKTDPPCPAHKTFLKLTCEFFEEYDREKKDPQEKSHFTDLVRSFWLPVDIEKERGPTIEKLYRATRLHQAGMKFKRMRNKSLLDIRAWTAPKTQGHSIKKGELYVPTLVMDDHTECLFRNLMALEQCHYPNEAFICEYVKFLDFLVDTKEDADLLIKSEVIDNRLGESDDVAKLINKLCLGMAEGSSCYSNIATDLNGYYKSHKRMAYLRRHYFKNIWMGTGTVVGLIVLLITLGNFVRSFF
ncbi:hypothetical protein NC652_029067 [Populus alba x Populus x berolinensis]|nr:hypothetical protein NC652_029067 [Populus alba x Populus x berolinensis]